MAKIVNETFKVGQKFIGMANNEEFKVVKIYRPTAKSKDKDLYVVFEDKNGKKHETNIEAAKRLLLA